MSWGWGGPKNGDPLYLDDCETPESPEDYKRIVKESIEEVIRLQQSKDWQDISYADERVHLSGLILEDSPLKCVRTSLIVDGSPKNVMKFLSSDDVVKRKKWDTELLELQVIDKIDDVEVVFQSYKAPFGITNRSFCATRAKRTLSDGTIIVGGTSVNHEKCPYNSSYVRGVATSAMIYKPVPGDRNKCHLTRIAKVDPKGNIPAMAINLGIKKAGDSVVTLYNVIKEESKKWPDETEEIEEINEEPSNINEGQDNLDMDGIEFTSDVSDGSDDEDTFFETSSYFEIPQEAIADKIEPLNQRLSFVEANTIHASKKLESILRKSKRQSRNQVVSFFNLSKITQIFILLWPGVILLLYKLYRSWKRSRK